MVGAAVMVQLASGRIRDARIALIGVGSTALRRPEAEQLLAGAEPTTQAFTAAGAEAARGLDPPSDLHGTAAYRTKVAAVMVRRALQDASERATT